ncbi:MAG: hypothetical protein Q9218_005084 [Villophora microphyllina]
MFKKKPNIKALAPLRSSDRRRIADQIIAQFHIDVPPKNDEHNPESGQESATISIGVIRNSLLPDNTQSARFTTTVGKDLKQVSGTVYVGTHPDEDQRVLWIKVEDRLIPTVYTLWRNPKITPLLHTPDVVLQKLRGGADLMTPGLAGPPFPHKATKGSIVAIASLEKPTVPMVVGTCEIDVASLKEVKGAKGHAVRGEHWEGDEIWSWLQGSGTGRKAPEEISGWADSKGPSGLEEEMGHVTVEDSEDEPGGGGVPVGPSTDEESKQKWNHFVEGEDGMPYEEVEVEERELSMKEIDDIFWNAFLYGLHHYRNTNRSDPHHGLDFPINQSAVISNLVLPFLPISTPAQAASLNVKKTSWKNAKKFIKAFDKARLLKSKDRDGGECVVLDIDFEDPAVTGFVPYKLPKKETAGAESGGGGGGKAITAGIGPSDDSIGQKLTKIELFKPKEQLAPLFSSSSSSHHDLYLATELRPITNSYIESASLISDTNRRLVNLDPVLANAVFDGSSPLDRELLAKGSVPRDALIDRILKSCNPFYVILRNEETRHEIKAKAGHAPKVHITLETRSGNKVVTKMSGVEAFYVYPQGLADELQKACASSTSVGQLAGSSPKKPVMEVMVQGPQKDAMIKALEKRGVHRQWIEVIDNAIGQQASSSLDSRLTNADGAVRRMGVMAEGGLQDKTTVTNHSWASKHSELKHHRIDVRRLPPTFVERTDVASIGQEVA